MDKNDGAQEGHHDGSVQKAENGGSDVLMISCINRSVRTGLQERKIGHVRRMWIGENVNNLDDATLEPLSWKDLVSDSSQESLFRVICKRKK
jgi:hypothetical protein